MTVQTARVATPTPPAAPHRLGLVLAVCCLGQFMNVLDASVVNVALPTIALELGFERHNLQWVTSAYTIALCGFLLLGGRLADVYGQRRIFLLGAALFTLASSVGGLASNAVTLVGARAFQGIGAAIMTPATLTVLGTTFTEPVARAKAFGMWSVVSGAGGAAGVILGGIITQWTSWRWTLLINVPLGLALIAGAYAFVPERAGRTGTGKLDLPGAVMVTLGLLGCVFGIAESRTYGWGSAPVVTALVGGAGLLAAFIVHQGKIARHPLVPLEFFKNRSVSAANLVSFFSIAALFSTFYFFTLILQQVLGYSPLQTGLSYLPMTIGVAVGGFGVSRLVPRYGPRPILFTGLSLACAGLLLLSTVDTTSTFTTGLLVPALLLGFGMGAVFNATTNAATSGLRPDQAGLGSGLLNTTRQLGSAIGLVVLATMASASTDALVGYSRALVGAAVLTALALLATFAIPRVR